MIRQGELVGRGLMAYETTEEVGAVTCVLVDLQRQRVVGLVCKGPGLMGRKQMVAWEQVVKIGGDRIVVHTAPLAETENQLAAGQEITDLEVWTDGGDHIGRIVDVRFDQATGAVEQYLFALHGSEETIDPQVEEALFGTEAAETDTGGTAPTQMITVYGIAPQMMISAGRKRMMIAEEDARRSRSAEETIPLVSNQPEDRATAPWSDKPLPEMPADFNELIEKGQSLANRVGDQVRQRAQQFRENQLGDRDFAAPGEVLPEITEQLQEKTAQVRKEMQTRLGKAKDRIEHQLEDGLGKTPIGERFNKTWGLRINKALDKFSQPKQDSDPIDVDAFEVWEDD